MQTHNFTLSTCDTDSITICKPDGSDFSKDEISSLTEELNSMYPELISWDLEPKIDKMLVIKTKNYVLCEEGKIKHKGSSLRDPKLEPALREFLGRIVDAILNENTNFSDIYNEYVKEAMNVKDIKRWSSRKTISSKTLESERTNESKIRDAIEDTEYVEGDRIFVFFNSDESLSLVEKFNGDYHKDKLLKKLFETGKRFSTVLNTKELFKNYALKKNKKELESVNS